MGILKIADQFKIVRVRDIGDWTSFILVDASYLGVRKVRSSS
jgi:hypothetical protein